MRPSEFEAIRPHLEQAVDDIDYFLIGLKEREKVQSEFSELYDLIAADKTPPEVKGQGKPELTPEQYAALEWRTAEGEPITDEQREAVLAGVLPGQPICDEGWAALQFALRGGWRESSRQAATWLRNAGETVAADGIDVALSQLSREPRDSTELSGYREAMRTATGQVKAILGACLADSAAGAKPSDAVVGHNVALLDEQDAAGDASAAVRLLNIYTNGLADERLEKASSVLNSDLTVDEKLSKIDELMPIPPSVSGEKLGKALGVSKTAVQNTSWYEQKRKGRKDEEIAQRGNRLRGCGQNYERDRQADDDE